MLIVPRECEGVSDEMKVAIERDGDNLKLVMPGLVPGIHDLPHVRCRVGGRDKPGHDDTERVRALTSFVIAGAQMATRDLLAVMPRGR
jgi:hypothetical protein